MAQYARSCCNGIVALAISQCSKVLSCIVRLPKQQTQQWPALFALQALRAALDNISVVACHSIHALLASLDEIAHQASLTVSMHARQGR
jgi:hypothetical protein